MALIKYNRTPKLNGVNPLAYVGVNPTTPTNFTLFQRDPTPQDYDIFTVGDVWLNQIYPPQGGPLGTFNVWMLVGKQAGIAKWIQFGGIGGDLRSLSGSTGTNPVFGDVNENILLEAGTGITTFAVAASNKITISTSGVVATQYTEDGATIAIPSGGNLNVFGTANQITTTGAGSTITISLNGKVANTFPTDFQSPAVPSANSLQIKGGVSLDAEQVALTFRKNIHTAANPMNSNLLEVKLNDSISLPNTIANGQAGIYYLGAVTLGNRFIHNFGSGNTFLGQASGNLTLSTANLNTAAGINSMQGLTTGSGNVAAGSGSLQLCQDGELNTAAGSSSLAALLSGDKNVCIGTAAAQSLVSGDQNTIVGEFAGSNYTGAESNNTIIGGGISGVIGETGIVRIGSQVGSTNTNNTFVGFQAGSNTYTLASAISNTIIGGSSGKNLTTGTLNVMLGANIGTTVSSAARLVLIGNGAGNSLTGNETDSIFILNGGSASASNTMSIGSGTGTGTNQLNKVFISGIAGITTVINDAVPVLISASTGQLGTVSSSKRFKDNIKDMGSLSDNIYKLRPVVFNYRKHSSEAKSVGLIAEEVLPIMPELVVMNEENMPETIKYQDLVPMLLNEIQKLNKRVEELERK